MHTECRPYRLGTGGEKGIRCESVAIPVAVCALPYQQMKVGHWETEKAGYGLYARVRRPALMLCRRCILHRHGSFNR